MDVILLLSAITQGARPVCHDDDDGQPKELPPPHSACALLGAGAATRLDLGAPALRRLGPRQARSLGHGVFGALDHGLSLLQAGRVREQLRMDRAKEGNHFKTT
ncbi:MULTISPECIES: hypothetical protein [unclassified Mesorhizobium]|uniref:hypothetical protein n=1 Tax=unclassified Mesorhizobium TaxID=325217 RepID=UPI0018ECBA68|nr:MULTISPECIES: hypothetical protein [unclassified Mesorhizobium]